MIRNGTDHQTIDFLADGRLRPSPAPAVGACSDQSGSSARPLTRGRERCAGKLGIWYCAQHPPPRRVLNAMEKFLLDSRPGSAAPWNQSTEKHRCARISMPAIGPEPTKPPAGGALARGSPSGPAWRWRRWACSPARCRNRYARRQESMAVGTQCGRNFRAQRARCERHSTGPVQRQSAQLHCGMRSPGQMFRDCCRSWSRQYPRGAGKR